jgi:hypothetical protein
MGSYCTTTTSAAANHAAYCSYLLSLSLSLSLSFSLSLSATPNRPRPPPFFAMKRKTQELGKSSSRELVEGERERERRRRLVWSTFAAAAATWGATHSWQSVTHMRNDCGTLLLWVMPWPDWSRRAGSGNNGNIFWRWTTESKEGMEIVIARGGGRK